MGATSFLHIRPKIHRGAYPRNRLRILLEAAKEDVTYAEAAAMLRSMVEGFAEVFLRDQWPSTPACKSLIMVRPRRRFQNMDQQYDGRELGIFRRHMWRQEFSSYRRYLISRIVADLIYLQNFTRQLPKAG
jgi:hypothetical protein